MPSLATTDHYIDLYYVGTPRLIACAVLETDDGLVLIDPGPSTSRETLLAGLQAQGASLEDVAAVLLTHIHLDHAGAAGHLVAEQPGLQVFVHEIGARHLANPKGLLRSAKRLYGGEMDRLWGTMQPVPEANLHTLQGGETLRLGGRVLDVAYTPGHAVHHVSFRDHATNFAFVGDTAGMCVAGTDYVMPVAPPPDIHLPDWHRSLETLRQWQPERLFLTHFGPSGPPDAHLAQFEEKLAAWSEEIHQTVTRATAGEADLTPYAQAFREAKLGAMRHALSSADQLPYETFSLPDATFAGLARYWKKEQELA